MIIPPRLQIDTEAHANPPVQWEETSCLLCGSERRSLLLEAQDPEPEGAGLWFAVARCQDCGLCYTNPRPNPASIGQFYAANYKPHQLPKRVHRPRHWLRLSRWFGGVDYRHALPLRGQGRLLDFGCGSGTYLARMHRQGWQVTGLDLSSQAVHSVRHHLKLPMLQGSLPHPELQPASFDIITMWASLEHVHDPLEALRAAHALLAPGGELVVSVPNLDSLGFRWFGRYWFGLELPRHLVHFTRRTLRLMLQRAGFPVQTMRMERHGSWLRYSEQLVRRLGQPTRWQRLLCKGKVAKLASWLALLRRQGDCITAVARKE